MKVFIYSKKIIEIKDVRKVEERPKEYKIYFYTDNEVVTCDTKETKSTSYQN